MTGSWNSRRLLQDSNLTVGDEIALELQLADASTPPALASLACREQEPERRVAHPLESARRDAAEHIRAAKSEATRQRRAATLAAGLRRAKPRLIDQWRSHEQSVQQHALECIRPPGPRLDHDRIRAPPDIASCAISAWCAASRSGPGHRSAVSWVACRRCSAGNITIYTELCEQARLETYQDMLQHARQLGANAIGVRYDATEIMAGLTEVLCYGTAVVVERTNG